jgi:hypothetical protein
MPETEFQTWQRQNLRRAAYCFDVIPSGPTRWG